jgi:glycosyltransferase involved in cell wall biosynthesis
MGQNYARQPLVFLKRIFKRIFSFVYVSFHVKHIYGPKKILATRLDCIVLSLVKDGEDYIEEFIKHYKTLGFKHIILMDNCSTDETISIASKHSNVTILRCFLSYGKHKSKMRQFMYDKYSFMRWCLMADCDEFLDYPHSDKLSLGEFIRYLEDRQFTAVLNQMLDLYPADEMNSEVKQTNPLFRQTHRWFEIESIHEKAIPTGLENLLLDQTIALHYGGVRERVFRVSPLISKFSLLKPNLWTYPVGDHLVSWGKIADVTCVLYHYKFLPNFRKKVDSVVLEQQYYKGSSEYRQYQKVLNQNSLLRFHAATSIELIGTEQLIQLGFLHASNRYIEYCELLQKFV